MLSCCCLEGGLECGGADWGHFVMSLNLGAWGWS